MPSSGDITSSSSIFCFLCDDIVGDKDREDAIVLLACDIDLCVNGYITINEFSFSFIVSVLCCFYRVLVVMSCYYYYYLLFVFFTSTKKEERKHKIHS